MADTPTPARPDAAPAPRTVYFDHAATSWPKAPGVADAMHARAGRTGWQPGTGRVPHGGRHGARHPRASAETPRRSSACPTRRTCSSSRAARRRSTSRCSGCLRRVTEWSRAPPSTTPSPVRSTCCRSAASRLFWPRPMRPASWNLDTVEALVAQAPTRAVVCQHAGNVTGAIQPVADLADIAHEHGALMIVDGAQAGGHLLVDLGTLSADVWACSGHKGLLGPQGVGLLYLAPGVRARRARVWWHRAGGERASRSARRIAPTATKPVRPTCPESRDWALPSDGLPKTVRRSGPTRRRSCGDCSRESTTWTDTVCWAPGPTSPACRSSRSCTSEHRPTSSPSRSTDATG